MYALQSGKYDGATFIKLQVPQWEEHELSVAFKAGRTHLDSFDSEHFIYEFSERYVTDILFHVVLYLNTLSH